MSGELVVLKKAEVAGEGLPAMVERAGAAAVFAADECFFGNPQSPYAAGIPARRGGISGLVRSSRIELHTHYSESRRGVFRPGPAPSRLKNSIWPLC